MTNYSGFTLTGETITENLGKCFIMALQDKEIVDYKNGSLKN